MSRIAAFSLLLLLPGLAAAATQPFTVTVAAGKHDRANEPVCVLVTLSEPLAQAQSVELRDADGRPVPAQLTGLGLVHSAAPAPAPGAAARREVHFILPSLKAGETRTFQGTLSTDPPARAEGFAWHDTPGDHLDLNFGDRPVLRYMYKALDESSKDNRDLTLKVYHHL